jgi:DNA-binding MarR family transcriptional regulator
VTRQERIIREMALPGNFFLVLTLPELRRHGISLLSLYALQRTLEVDGDRANGYPYSEQWLRSETGLADYETSRACNLLARGGLVTVTKANDDRRVRDLKPTERGRRVLDRIMSEAGRRLWSGIQPAGRIRRVQEATEHLRKANRILHGPLQLTFFDKDLFLDGQKRNRKKRTSARPVRKRSDS